MGIRMRRGFNGFAGIALLLVCTSCGGWEGFQRGVYEGATANERDRLDQQGRPAGDLPPSYDQYDRHRTGGDARP